MARRAKAGEGSDGAGPEERAKKATAPPKSRAKAGPAAPRAKKAAAPAKTRTKAGPAAPRAKKAAAPAKPRAKAASQAPLAEGPVESAATGVAALPDAPLAFQTPDPAPPPALPCATGRDHLFLVPLDARTFFLSWELTPGGLTRARSALTAPEGRSELMLRLYLTADSESPVVRDEPVGAWIGRRRVTVEQAGARLSAAVGFRAGDVFVGVARSGPAHWPLPGTGRDPVRFVDLSGDRPVPVPTPSSLDLDALRRTHRAAHAGARS